MGRVIPFNRRQPSRSLQSTPSDESPYPSLRPTIILIVAFFGVAMVMTAVVAVLVATSWTDVAWFVGLIALVALAKIVFATVLFFTLVSSDSEPENQPVTEKRADLAAKQRRTVVRRASKPTPIRLAISAKPSRSGPATSAYESVDGTPPRLGS